LIGVTKVQLFAENMPTTLENIFAVFLRARSSYSAY